MHKRIVFFISSMGDGGAQRVLSMISERLANDYDITILTYYDIDPSYELSKKVKLACVGEQKVSLNGLLSLRRYFRKNADVIVSFLAPFNILALFASLGLRIPIIVADRNDPRMVPEKRIVRLLRDLLYNFADRIVVQTNLNKEYFSRRQQRKCDVIYNPVDLGKMVGAGINSEKRNRIVSVGRLERQKNQKLLIEAFIKVHKFFPNYELTIYGEGSYRSELEELVAKLKLNECVKLPGATSNVFDQIKDAKLFVLSSNYEGMPNALLEAMCLGIPVISTKVSGATDIIENGVNGSLVDCTVDKVLAEEMISIISNDEKQWKYAHNAVKLADKLSIVEVTNQWKHVIEKVL